MAKAKKATSKGRVKAGNPVGSRGRAGKGHNSSILHAVPDETVERCITLLDKDRKGMEKAKAELDSVRGVYRDRRKKFEKDGLNLHAYDNIVKLRSMDLGKVQVDSADTGRYLRILQHPLATQLELFQNITVPEPVVDANLQGQAAGKNAERAENNPYTPGTESFAAWAEGWVTGQAMVAEGLRH